MVWKCTVCNLLAVACHLCIGGLREARRVQKLIKLKIFSTDGKHKTLAPFQGTLKQMLLNFYFFDCASCSVLKCEICMQEK